MKNSDNVKEYSSKLMETMNQIRIFGEAFSVQKDVTKIFISLPQKIKSKVSSFEESFDLTTIKIAKLIAKL